MQLLKAQFINHNGKKLDFGSAELFLNASDLRDYEHEAIIRGNRIRGWRRGGIKDKTVPIAIYSRSEYLANKAKDRLFEIAEEDVADNIVGKFIVNGYELMCFINGQTFQEWTDEKFLITEMKVKTTSGLWVKRGEPLFFSGGDVQTLPPEDSLGGILGEPWYDGTKDYEYAYPYNYWSATKEHQYVNNTGSAVGFRLIVYGPVMSPVVVNIAGIPRRVKVSLGDNERLEIVSLDKQKTITLVRENGEKVNCYNLQDYDNDIFKYLPVGENKVTWNGDFSFYLIPVEERSSPSWL